MQNSHDYDVKTKEHSHQRARETRRETGIIQTNKIAAQHTHLQVSFIHNQRILFLHESKTYIIDESRREHSEKLHLF